MFTLWYSKTCLVKSVKNGLLCVRRKCVFSWWGNVTEVSALSASSAFRCPTSPGDVAFAWFSSVRRTLEPFERQRWGNFWETGWSAYGLFRAHRYHLELNWTNCEGQSHTAVSSPNPTLSPPLSVNALPVGQNSPTTKPSRLVGRYKCWLRQCR